MVELIYVFDHQVLLLKKVFSSFFFFLIFSYNLYSERYISDPRAIELENQIQSAVAKQKRPDSSISGGDDSEAFPTSDDHQLASCSASASDQGVDIVENLNRFDALNRDYDEKEQSKLIKNTRRRARRKSNNSNQHADEDENDEEGEVDEL
jgi:hypothetical protein